MATVDIEKLKAGLNTYFEVRPDLFRILRRVGEDPWRALANQDLANLLKYGARHLERMRNDIEGPDKKGALLEWLDEILVFDGWLEQIDGWVIRMTVGKMIDKIVEELNETDTWEEGDSG